MRVRAIQGFDIPYLAEIDLKSYNDPWDKDQFRQFGSRAVVAVEDAKVIGYYMLKGTQLLRFAIHPSWRRMGHGTELMEAAKGDAVKKMSTIVAESNLGAQAFLRYCGLRCVNILPGKFHDLDVTEDGYYFLWRRQ